MKQKKVNVITVLFLSVLLMGMAGIASASTTLWYSGDLNPDADNMGNDHQYQWYGYSGITYFQEDAHVYDNFNVPAGSGWTLDSVWSNNFLGGANVLGASYEIRSGVSAGNGGTLVAHGNVGNVMVGSDTGTVYLPPTTGASLITDPTGRNDSNGENEYKVQISGLNINLTPGDYWLNVTPAIDTISHASVISGTTGVNAIGQPASNDGASYNNLYAHFGLGTTYAVNFNSIADAYYGPRDFSMGVVGVSTVPLPAAMWLFGSGLIGLVAVARRRRAKAMH